MKKHSSSTAISCSEASASLRLGQTTSQDQHACRPCRKHARQPTLKEYAPRRVLGRQSMVPLGSLATCTPKYHDLDTSHIQKISPYNCGSVFPCRLSGIPAFGTPSIVSKRHGWLLSAANLEVPKVRGTFLGEGSP